MQPHQPIPPADDPHVATVADAQRYQFRSLTIVLLLFSAYGAVVALAMPGWILMIMMLLLLPRWMIYTHELFHLRGPTQVDFATRLMPLPFTPFALGYDEFRQIHFRHHKHPATRADPDAFHLLGGPWRAAWGALTVPEQAFFRWIRQPHGIRTLSPGFWWRIGIFGACLLVGGWTFLWFWIPLRLVYALGDFSFFYLPHVRDGVPGTYCLKLPRAFQVLAELLYGRTLVRATMFHDRHHLHPSIQARALPFWNPEHL